MAPGAAVRIGDRYLVIGVSTGEFSCQGQKFIGVSQAAPIYEALEGKEPVNSGVPRPQAEGH